eukprot:ANDGO_03788.mRNA.1 hypothetical protein
MWQSKYFFRSPSTDSANGSSSGRVESSTMKRVSVSVPHASNSIIPPSLAASSTLSTCNFNLSFPYGPFRRIASDSVPFPGSWVPPPNSAPYTSNHRYFPTVLRRPCASGVCARIRLCQQEEDILKFLASRRKSRLAGEESHVVDDFSGYDDNVLCDDDLGFYAYDDSAKLPGEELFVKLSATGKLRDESSSVGGETSASDESDSQSSSGDLTDQEYVKEGNESSPTSGKTARTDVVDADALDRAAQSEAALQVEVGDADSDAKPNVEEEESVGALGSRISDSELYEEIIREKMETISREYFNTICSDFPAIRPEQEQVFKGLLYDVSYLLIVLGGENPSSSQNMQLYTKSLRALSQIATQPKLLQRILQRAPEFLMAVLRILTNVSGSMKTFLFDEVEREAVLSAFTVLCQSARYLQNLSYGKSDTASLLSPLGSPTFEVHSPKSVLGKDMLGENSSDSKDTLEHYGQSVETLHYTVPAVMAFLDGAWSVSSVVRDHSHVFCNAFKFLTSICKSHIVFEDKVDAKQCLRSFGIVPCTLRYILAAAFIPLRKEALLLLVAFGDSSIATEYQVAILADDPKLGSDLLADIRIILDGFLNFVEDEDRRLLFIEVLRLVAILARHPQNRRRVFEADMFPPLFRIVDHFHKNTLRVGNAFVHVQVQRMAMEIMGFWFPLDVDKSDAKTTSLLASPSSDPAKAYVTSLLNLFFKEALPVLLLVLDSCPDRYVRKAASFALAHLSEHKATHSCILEKSLLPAQESIIDQDGHLSFTLKKRPILTLCDAGDFSALVVVANLCENADLFRKLRSSKDALAIPLVSMIAQTLTSCVLKFGNVGFFPQVASTALAHLSAMEVPHDRELLSADDALGVFVADGDTALPDTRVFDGEEVRAVIASFSNFIGYIVRTLASYLSDGSASSGEKTDSSPLIPRNLSLLLVAFCSSKAGRLKLQPEPVFPLLLKAIQIANKRGFTAIDSVVHRNLLLSLCYCVRHEERYFFDFSQKVSSRLLLDLVAASRNMSDYEPYLLFLLAELAKEPSQHVYFRTSEHCSLLLALLGVQSSETKFAVLRILSQLAKERRTADWMLREGIVGRVWQLREHPNRFVKSYVENVVRIIHH